MREVENWGISQIVEIVEDVECVKTVEIAKTI
jgi:hypothetical protein